MYRGIIGLVEGEPDGEISNNRGGTDIEGMVIDSFDDGRLVSGKAVGSVERERQRPVVGDDYITTEEETEIEKAYVEFLANLPDGWVTLDTSDGEFLWNFLAAKHYVDIGRAEVDLTALARDMRDWERVDVWQSQTTWGDPGDESDSPGGVTISYHGDADWSDGDRLGQLGFEGRWDGVYLRGTITESGYLALFNRGDETAAAFLSQAVIPHCSIPEDEQETFIDEIGGGV